MIDIQAEHRDIVEKILDQWIPQMTVWAFGSRVTGKAKPYSDLDLVMIGKEKCPLKLLYQLQDAFEASSLPYRIDIVDWHRISPQFQEIIKEHKAVFIEKKNEAGNALITALFIMTLIAIASTALIYRLNTDIARTTSFIQSDNVYLAAQLVPFWGMGELTRRDNLPKRYDNGALLFSLPQEPQALYPGYQIAGKIYDLQSRFNLNNLSEGNMQPSFLQLLKSVDPTLTSAVRKLITRATLEWISNPTPANNFTSYYRKMTPPYQSANQLMVSVSEWNQVAGVQPTLYQKMSPFLTALPEVTPININTASKTVLLALNPKIDLSHIETLRNVREQGGIQTQGALIQWAKTLGIDASLLTYESRYFLSVATVRHGKKVFTLYDIIQRTRKKPADPWVARIISEHL